MDRGRDGVRTVKFGSHVEDDLRVRVADLLMPAPRLADCRDEFDARVGWGVVSGNLRRFELSTPELPCRIVGAPNAVACLHAGRSSLIVRVDGGHLVADKLEVLRRLRVGAQALLGRRTAGPAEHIAGTVAWLEEEWRAGCLQNSFTVVLMLVVVSDGEVWSWLMSPTGLLEGPPGGLVVRSADIRYPAQGIRYPPLQGLRELEEASSTVFVGTPAEYERIRVARDPGAVVVGLDGATFPFGPLPERVSLEQVWSSEALWRHGVAGRGVVIGSLKPEELQLPKAWAVREVPIDA